MAMPSACASRKVLAMVWETGAMPSGITKMKFLGLSLKMARAAGADAAARRREDLIVWSLRICFRLMVPPRVDRTDI